MKLPARLKALPWADAGVVGAVVVLGVSQIFFSLIRENADHFPQEPWFHLGVIAWTALFPFALLLPLDLALARGAGRESRGFAAWRAALYTFLFASMLRQAQVYHPAAFLWILERIPPRPLLLSTLALVFLVCLRFHALARRYVATLGLLAVLLLGVYSWTSGLFGSGWRGPKVAPRASAIAWTNDPIVFIIFDELSNDVLLKDGRIDAERFPRLAALAADAAWFTNANSDFYYTLESIPSMLSGRLYPAEDSPRLFDFLPSGCGVVARTYWSPTYRWMRKNARQGHDFLLAGRMDDPFDRFSEIPGELADLFQQTPFSHSPFGFTPARRIHPRFLREGPVPTQAVEAEIEGFFSRLTAKDAAGKLLWWHCPLPHSPYVFEPDGRRHGDASSKFLGGPNSTSGRDAPAGYDPGRVMENYRKQVGFADHVLGRVVDRLRSEGLYERTTLIVTSDHGLRTLGVLEPKDWPQVVAGGINRVPLLIRGPRVRPGAYGLDVRHVDLLPTVLDALGIPYDPAGFEGISAFGPARPARPRRLLGPRQQAYAYDAARDVWTAVQESP